MNNLASCRELYTKSLNAKVKAHCLWQALSNNLALKQAGISISVHPSHWAFRVYFNQPIKHFPKVAGLSISTWRGLVRDPPVIEIALIDIDGEFIFEDGLDYNYFHWFCDLQEVIEEIFDLQHGREAHN